ncbi:MAG: hypothetical protein AABZ80_04315 [Gemmatimonadota bacterium]
MTVCLTAARHFAIVMTVDSAVVQDFDDGHREYSTGRKAFVLPGIGVVSTWGARDGNQIMQELPKLQASSRTLSIADVSEAVRRYLEFDFRPHDRGSDPVGYHIAGFREPDAPVVYHVYWKPESDESNTPGGYVTEKHDPSRDGVFMLWNGREDLVEDVLVAINRERKRKKEMPLPLEDAAGLVALGHLAMRFAREVSFDVSPPYFAHVITPENRVHSAELPEWIPINDRRTAQVNQFMTGIAGLRFVHRLVAS